MGEIRCCNCGEENSVDENNYCDICAAVIYSDADDLQDMCVNYAKENHSFTQEVATLKQREAQLLKVVANKNITITKQQQRVEELEVSERIHEMVIDQAIEYLEDNPISRYDLIAEWFYKETRMMAPGKSCPPAMCGGQVHGDELHAKFEEWRKSKKLSLNKQEDDNTPADKQRGGCDAK